MRVHKHKGPVVFAAVIPLLLAGIMAGCCNGADGFLSSITPGGCERK